MLIIVHRSKETLKDLSLEPRDCFQLWQTMVKHENGSYPVGRHLDPNYALPEMIKKPDITKWEVDLKNQLGNWMVDPNSPFDDVHSDLQASSNPSTDFREAINSTFSLLVDLRSRGAVPAILFNYDRVGCEKILVKVLETLETAEQEYRETSTEWKVRVNNYERREAQRARKQAKTPKATGSRRDDKNDGTASSKMDNLREDASQEASPDASFDPNAPIEQFSFADWTKTSTQELDALIASMSRANIKKPIIDALRRGLGVHHAGMNRQYRQVYVSGKIVFPRKGS
jgi:ATP-dependent RNA helicase DDX60